VVPSRRRILTREDVHLMDKSIQMIPSAFEDFCEVSGCCEGTKRQICTTNIEHVATTRIEPKAQVIVIEFGR
jgi:hypothetical protein